MNQQKNEQPTADRPSFLSRVSILMGLRKPHEIGATHESERFSLREKIAIGAAVALSGALLLGAAGEAFDHEQKRVDPSQKTEVPTPVVYEEPNVAQGTGLDQLQVSSGLEAEQLPVRSTGDTSSNEASQVESEVGS